MSIKTKKPGIMLFFFFFFFLRDSRLQGFLGFFSLLKRHTIAPGSDRLLKNKSVDEFREDKLGCADSNLIDT